MRFLVLVILAASPAAFAGPRTLPKVTSYRLCVTHNMCGAGRDGGYESHGEYKECTRYTFRPNGTYVGMGKGGGRSGRYRVIGRTVRLTPVIDKKAGPSFNLVLSADGSMLGDLKRMPPEPPRSEPFVAP